MRRVASCMRFRRWLRRRPTIGVSLIPVRRTSEIGVAGTALPGDGRPGRREVTRPSGPVPGTVLQVDAELAGTAPASAGAAERRRCRRQACAAAPDRASAQARPVKAMAAAAPRRRWLSGRVGVSGPSMACAPLHRPGAASGSRDSSMSGAPTAHASRRSRRAAPRPRPETGAVISTIALSVMMSTVAWSSSIRSPMPTCQAVISASATPSPMSGRRIRYAVHRQPFRLRRIAAITRSGPGK